MPLFPSSITLDTTPPPTYRVVTTVVAAIGQAFELIGSGSTTVKITRIVVTAAAPTVLSVTKQSTLSSGSAATPTITSLDSTNSAPTAVANTYTTAPTPGTSAGDLVAPADSLDESFGNLNDQPPTLNSASQSIAISTTVATTLTIMVEWTE